MLKRPLAAVIVFLTLAPPALAADDYRAEVRRTTGGWAHVKAADHGSLGFGYGYAYAQDQACELAEIVVTVNAGRTRAFGAGDGNLESDFFYQRIKDTRTVEKLLRRRSPHGPSRTARATVRGFAAGFNAFLRRRGTNDPRCRGESWLRPITPLDLYRRFYQLGLRASSGNFLEEIVAAQPPAAGAAARSAAAPDPEAFSRRLDAGALGSNAYGIGSTGTRGNGDRSLVLGNPHFPWEGSERWYEIHLTIPGKLNAIGAALQGVPVVNIGFNRRVAWSHTVSTARRFTPYELQLVPGNPTQYVVDGRPVNMRERTVRVAGRSHTFYETRWGPVFSFPAAGLTWTAERAFAFADVNADNFRLINQWERYDRAQSVRDLRRAYASAQGNPWVNTIAADSRGKAYYADDSVVPNVDAALIARCSDNPIAPLLLAQGVALLDGSRSECAWQRDRDALDDGIIGPRGLPRITRRDYVANSNDSYWLPNADARIGGFPRIIGAERTQRLLRTRLALTQAEQRLAGSDGLGAPGFTLPTLQRVMFGNRNLSAELARDAFVTACKASGRPDLAEACGVLEAWDGRADVGSRGAVLWRETLSRLTTSIWTVPFDPADPVNTPRGVDPANPDLVAALAAAVADLRAKGIPLDVPLGRLQAEPRGRARIPIHGCSEAEGCFNIITTDRDEQGRYDPYTGASFVMTAAFDRRGRPRGEALLSYSQSANPRSPHYADQTRRFSRKQWIPMRFTERSIRRDRAYRRTVVTGRR